MYSRSVICALVSTLFLAGRPMASQPESCTVHTYFDENVLIRDGEESIAGQRATLQAWVTAWAAAGWQPRVLDESAAKNHPDFYTLRAKFQKLPTVNSKEYELACFLRHVALAAVGGGWMSDYDVVPVNMPPCLALPNKGRFTTHEKFIPSLVSGSADECTRVAHLLGDVPWEDHPQLFSDSDRPHVSDMVALKFIGDSHDISMAARGCGVVSPDKIFKKGECATCRYGGAPLAMHFSHSAMDKRKFSSNHWKVTLNCSTAKDSYPHWNHWRAACLADASALLRNLCGHTEAKKEVAATATLGGGEVNEFGGGGGGEANEVWRREGASCHEECGGESGACSEFCGPGGVCCRKGFGEDALNPECLFGVLGCEGSHCCANVESASLSLSSSEFFADSYPTSEEEGFGGELLPANEVEIEEIEAPPTAPETELPPPVALQRAALLPPSHRPYPQRQTRSLGGGGGGRPSSLSKTSSLCSEGLVGSEGTWPVCCPLKCGSCGGAGCNQRPGGVDECCSSGIAKVGKRCRASSDSACVLLPPDPFAALRFAVPVLEVSEGLAHMGLECLAECGGGSKCRTGFCGPSGACCKQGVGPFDDKSECGFGALGCKEEHCCVASAEPPASRELLSNEGDSCYTACGGHSGPCPGFCGNAGSCCRENYSSSRYQATCGFGTVGCQDFHCCAASAQ